MRTLLLLPMLPLLACPGDSDGSGDKTDTSSTVEPRTMEDFVDVTTPYEVGEGKGAADCYTGTLGTESADASCVSEATVTGAVEDFQTGDGVPDVTVQVWADDDITSSDYIAETADSSGAFSTTIPTCQPFGYGTSTPAEWEETVDTFEVHQIFGPTAESVIFNSVSQATSRLIPGLIGVDWDQTTGIIAGAMYDCNEDPIQYGQVFIHKEGEDTAPATGDVFYFSVDGEVELPTQRETQPHTNTNGLWVAVNIPDGEWVIDGYGWDGTTHVLLGSTEITINPGSVNISNVYLGIEDGISFPDSCKTTCE